MMNCFAGGSHVRRNPDDRDAPPPPGDFGEARFDLDFTVLDLEEDMSQDSSVQNRTQRL